MPVDVVEGSPLLLISDKAVFVDMIYGLRYIFQELVRVLLKLSQLFEDC